MSCPPSPQLFYLVTKIRNKEKYYIHNIIIIFLQQIISNRLLLTVINKYKINFNNKFKSKLITTYVLF